MPLSLDNIQAADLFKALSTIGGTMGQPGGTLAGGLGQAGSDLIEAKGLRRAGTQQAQQAQTFQDQLIQALAGGQLLSDPSDNTRPDSMTIDGKGNVTLKAGIADAPVAFQGEQTPLEAQQVPRQGAQARGYLPPFYRAGQR